MMENLGDMRDAADEQKFEVGFANENSNYSEMLEEAAALYREQTRQSDFWTGFKFESFDAMGSAIGIYKTGPDAKFLRPDAVSDLTTLTHTTIHETYHQNGLSGEGKGCGDDCCFSDGFIEWRIYKDMGEDYKPVDAYAGIAKAAGEIVDELGNEAYELASQGAQSTELLTQALFSSRLAVMSAVGAENDDVAVDVGQIWNQAHDDVEATLAA